MLLNQVKAARFVDQRQGPIVLTAALSPNKPPLQPLQPLGFPRPQIPQSFVIVSETAPTRRLPMLLTMARVFHSQVKQRPYYLVSVPTISQPRCATLTLGHDILP